MVKKQTNSYLFKLFPGTIVEIEDCDIEAKSTDHSQKLVCIQINSQKKKRNESINYNTSTNQNMNSNQNIPYTSLNQIILEDNKKADNNNNNINNNNNNNTNINNNTSNKNNMNCYTAILTVRSTRFSSFYQTIRASENSIINIERCNINNNYGKSVVILNPLITKIVESVFEKNLDNAIHFKFMNENNNIMEMLEDRKIFFDKNEVIENYGTGVYIDGTSNEMQDLRISVTNNLFKRNKIEGMFLCDLNLTYLTIENNQFRENKNNGLNIRKVTHNQEKKCPNTSNLNQEYSVINIKGNEFSDSDGFGAFINESRAVFTNNNFIRNKSSGLILCNISLIELCKEIKSMSSSSTQNTTKPNLIENGTTHIIGCNFQKNGYNGIKFFNYSFYTNIIDSKFSENCDFGIHLENEQSLKRDKIKNYQLLDKTNTLNESHLVCRNSNIYSNLKSGICLINSFLYLENTQIEFNIDYAIYISKIENKNCSKFPEKDKNNNMINGNIGGPWGEIQTVNKFKCDPCNSTKNTRVRIIEHKSAEDTVKSKSDMITESKKEISKTKHNSEQGAICRVF